LSERSREHIHPVMLNATFYVGITKLQARLECSKSAAILYALNDGLLLNGAISEEDHELLVRRYGRKLKDVIAEGKENSHVSKLELERKKRQAMFCPQKDSSDLQITRLLRGIWEQWDTHIDLAWRIKKIAYAKEYPDNEFAKLIISKEKECDIISQGEVSNA
jgi:hypothetical protein